MFYKQFARLAFFVGILFFSSQWKGWSSFCAWGGSSGLPPFEVEDDEFVLPPLLLKYLGGSVINVNSGSERHGVEAGEWLDRDSEFSLPARLSIHVLMNETIQWVGGGVLQLKLTPRKWARPLTPYKMNLERGFLAVWVNAQSADEGIEIVTPEQKFIAVNAVFWLNVMSSKVTELYLIQGTVLDSTGRIWNTKKYMSYRKDIKAVSVDWDPEPYKVRIAGVFPDLVKLMDQGDREWSNGGTKEAYAAMRKKGWRKSLRKYKKAKDEKE